MLTDRQVKLIEAIVHEYIDTAEPVGSEALVDKYDIKVSPATVRNEMVELIEQGYLEKPHFSAGRIPTHIAFRHYIQHLMEEEPLSVVDEVSIKQRLWEKRADSDGLVRQAVQDLSRETSNLAFSILRNGVLYHSGSANILNHPEFYDIDVTRSVLRLLDDTDLVSAIFHQVSSQDDVGTLLSHELGLIRFLPVVWYMDEFGRQEITKDILQFWDR